MDPEVHATMRWQVYEANVQAYRSQALTTQSILLAVGAILLRSFGLSFFAVLVIAMLSTWWVFFPVIFARSAIVDYHKVHMSRKVAADGQRATSATQDFLAEKEYARLFNVKLRKVVYASMAVELGGKTHRLTRLKLDVFLPLMLSSVWVFYVISGLRK